MRIWYVLSGLFLIIFICLLPIKQHLQEFKVQMQGTLVNAQITYVPHPIGCKLRYSMKFIYEGEEYSKSVRCNFDDTHKVGDIIQLKHIEGADMFLFKDENIITEFLAFAALFLFGFFLIIHGSKKKS
jgi:hypothetical protein